MRIKKIPISAIRQKYRKLNISRKWIFLALFLWALSFVIQIWPILFLLLFCMGNAVLLSIDRYVSAPIDIELSTFSAILMTTRYGLAWGIVAAVLTKVAAIAYNKNVRIDHFFMIAGYVLAAFIASSFHGMNIVLLGIIVAVITNLYTFFVSKFVTMLSSYEIFMYGGSNFIFNTVLFIGFSEIFQRLMF